MAIKQRIRKRPVKTLVRLFPIGGKKPTAQFMEHIMAKANRVYTLQGPLTAKRIDPVANAGCSLLLDLPTDNKTANDMTGHELKLKLLGEPIDEF